MNCLSIRKQYYSQYLTFSLYLFPLSYPSVSLNLSMGRMFARFFNPFRFDYSTIRPLSHVKKILGKFHLVPLSRLSSNGCTIFFDITTGITGALTHMLGEAVTPDGSIFRSRGPSIASDVA